MDKVLAYLAKLSQIDVVLTTYNFAMRSVNAAINTNPDAPTTDMTEAIRSAWKAGLGIVAMKVMAGGVSRVQRGDRLYGAVRARPRAVLGDASAGQRCPMQRLHLLFLQMRIWGGGPRQADARTGTIGVAGRKPPDQQLGGSPLSRHGLRARPDDEDASDGLAVDARPKARAEGGEQGDERRGHPGAERYQAWARTCNDDKTFLVSGRDRISVKSVIAVPSLDRPNVQIRASALQRSA
jgi:hypothetical protein